MPVSNAPLGSFIAFGSDTDCDGTSYYICGVFARDLVHAREVLREEFGSMTCDGINEIVTGSEARWRGIDVDKLMNRTSENGVWNEQTHEWESVTVPFRYATSLYGDTDNILSVVR